MADIVCERVTKVYPDGTVAVADLDLEIPDGALMVLLGPSGCGKTTLLRMIAGLESISSGTISVGGRVVNDVRPKDRDIAMVFQNYALYPHMTVEENMGFSLKLRRTPKPRVTASVAAAAATLGLTEHLKKKPRHLSGGQRQRVAMGRAMVREPQAFLMDEPLSNLDAKLRVRMRAEIARLQRELGATTVYVTHDQTEAMTLGDIVAVMQLGVLQQVDSPQGLYRAPANLFVASFIGSPPMNLVQATLHGDADGLSVQLGNCRLDLGAKLVAARPNLHRSVGRSIVLGFRPESLYDRRRMPGAASENCLSGSVDLCEDMGSETYVYFSLDGVTPVHPEQPDSAALGFGHGEAEELVETPPGQYIARLEAGADVREGAQVELAVEPEALYFFDPETGVNLVPAAASAGTRLNAQLA